jgi:hypothetical protein
VGPIWSRVARFFLAHDTQTGKNVPNEYKMYQMVIKYPNACKLFQMTIKHINIYQYMALQNLPILGFWFENKPSGNPDLVTLLSSLKIAAPPTSTISRA